MKILWVTNIAIPTIAKDAGISISHSGGWISQMCERICKEHDLTYMFPFPVRSTKKEGYIHSLHYCSFPFVKTPSDLCERTISYFVEQIKKESPDVIQIWGTEYLHSYAVFQACTRLGMLDKTVIHIQGLVSVYKDYYWCYIDDPEVRKPTLKDRIRKSGPVYEFKDFCVRSEYEVEILSNAKHVLGRTDWDRYHVTKLNQGVNYHFCNETLRETFYSGAWLPDKCYSHGIFVSQGNYPLKGLHLAIEGLRQLKEKYPDIVLFCTGKKRANLSLKELLRESSYDRYIRKLITKHHLEKNIVFLGVLDSDQMKKQYLHANVFLSPSSIENSSNSIGEAMLLGVPVVSSDVGGVRNFVEDGISGFIYPADQISKMVECIDKVFSSEETAVFISKNEKEKAKAIFDADHNYSVLMSVYRNIADKQPD